MCEPEHSFIQLDDDDFNDGQSGKPRHWIGRFSGVVKGWTRQIGRFLHLSKFGSGHHVLLPNKGVNKGTLYHALSAHTQCDPAHIKWETDWARRELKFDNALISDPDQLYSMYKYISCYGVHKAQQQIADFEYRRQVAEQYSKESSTGNLSKLRRFLETSLNRTDNPLQYISRFCQMLTPKGADIYMKKIDAIISKKKFNKRMVMRHHLSSVISATLGFTRRRGLLIPCWADDADLWKKSKSNR